jgi:predicted GIY-YIG superfamily endonuclease
MSVYLLHFSEPISEKHTCQHYIGYANDVEDRIRQHEAGYGARLTQVAIERGISWEVVRIWTGGRDVERRLKNIHNAPRLCPICSGGNR